MVELRRLLLLPWDNLLAVTRESFTCTTVSHLGLDRCLRRHGLVLPRPIKLRCMSCMPRIETFHFPKFQELGILAKL